MVKMSISEKTLRMNAEIPILPVVKTEGMTQPVGRDPNGRLWTEPGGGGLNPMKKTDAMTAEVGRDEQGRLWAKESRKGVKYFGFGELYHPDPSRPRGRYLGVGLEDGTTALVLIQDLARELGIDKILGLPEYTEADEGKFMRIINGAPVWSAVINGEEVKF